MAEEQTDSSPAQVARLQQQLQQREAELAVTNRIGALLASAPDLKHVFEGARIEIMSIIPCTGLSFFLLTRNKKKLDWIYGYELGHEVDLRDIPPQPLNVGYSGHVIRSGAPLHLTNTAELDNTALNTVIVGETYSAWLGIPLTVANQTIGVLALENNIPFSQRQIDLLQTISAPIAIAIQNARLFEETNHLLAESQKRTAELATINNVSSAIATQLNFDALIQLVGEQIRTVFKADIVYIALHDKRTNQIHFPYEYGDKNPSRPFARGLTEQIINSRQPLLINQDIDKHHKAYATQQIGVQQRSYLGVPIVVDNHAIGVISVQSQTEEECFTRSDLHLLATIAANVSTAVHNAQLYQQTQRRTDELATLAEIGHDMASSAELQPVLERIIGRIRTLMGVRDIALFMLDADEATLRPIVAQGEYAPAIRNNLIQLGSGITGAIARNGQAEFVNYPAKDPRAIHITGTPDPEEDEEGLMAAPITINGRVEGVLILWRPHSEGLFTQAELTFLVNVARYVASAIGNGRQIIEAQRRAKEMTALAEVGWDILATLNRQTVIERIVTHARELLLAHTSAIYLLQADNHTLKPTAAVGEIATAVSAFNTQVGLGFVGHVVATGIADTVKDTSSDGRTIHIKGTKETPPGEKLLAAPLMLQNNAIGAMVVWRGPQDEPFTDAELRFLVGLAQQAVIAIQNAHLFEQAQQARTAAEEASHAKSAFLANMSHELRTPLNAIIGFTRLVKRRSTDLLPAKQLDNLDKVLLSAEHLLGLINSILDIAKIEAGRVDVNPRWFNLDTVLDICLTTTQPLIKKESVSLEKEIITPIPPIYSDEEKVKQILLNLLSNAAKFTPFGAITIRASHTTDQLIIEVIDTGIGIPPEALHRIFEEFQQVDSSTTREYGGTGLGLSISLHLAQLLRGNLSAHSQPGIGATFILTLPLHFTQPTQPAIPTSHPPTTSSQPSTPHPQPIILAIDDQPDVIYLLQENLAESGYTVIGALNGEDGLQKARQLQPFAIILDIMMPHKDGWQVLHDLKTDPQTHHIPVIMLSIVDKKELGYRLGATDYLIKPLNNDAVLSVLNRIPTPPTRQSPARLLVVDDDPQVADMVGQLLENEPYQVETAVNGQDALHHIHTNPPDIILLDLMMPQLDGFGVISHLHQNPALRHIPVIVLTAKTLTNTESAQLTQSVQQVMRKQGLLEESLIAELQQALRQYKPAPPAP
jgi:signal transduction histidine kinase/CheY-like chemotaxis protein